ncbi:transmembrane protein, putative [Medicago truncatula]|uniref:Transmembrane protein, putative n=1 Tax=Medicago truncatula TaxID=3880 RepID=A0A072V2N6_MEDTR|nr:transmembrane protein, putative [Medicago truncatula]
MELEEDRLSSLPPMNEVIAELLDSFTLHDSISAKIQIRKLRLLFRGIVVLVAMVVILSVVVGPV